MTRVTCTWLARLWAGAIVFAIAAAAHAAPAKQWTIIPLGGTFASALNNRGDVGGFARVAEPPGSFPPFFAHAVIWRHGGMEDLTTLGTLPARAFTQVAAVNDAGTFVVTCSNFFVSLCAPAGVLTYKDGLFTPLGFTGAPSDINNAGVIVGSVPNGAGDSPFVYRNGVLEILGTLGGVISRANAVNEDGLVVGSSQLPDQSSRGFIYKDGAIKFLGTFGGASSFATDVNNHGVIIGGAQDSTGRMLAFVTDESGVLFPFLDLPGNQSAIAINQRGDIVGSATGSPFNTAYLYSNGEVTNLSELPQVKAEWFFILPTNINDRGWILGIGNRRGGAVTGEAFLLVRQN
jgi:probable HAF family extracellular repeat protein